MIDLNSDNISSNNLVRRFWQYGKLGVWVAILVHALFIVMFWTLEVHFMAYFNVFSVILFIYCAYLVERERFESVIMLSHIEVIAHALFATLAIGVASGFYYYLFILVILSFVVPQKSVSYKLLKITAFIALFFIIEIVFSVFVSPLYYIDENVLFAIRSFNLISLLIIASPIIYFHVKRAKDTEELLYKHATIDPLTGLFNRRHFVSIADYEYSKRDKKSLSLILTDIDYFKKINDTYGHEVGDIVLKTVSKFLTKELRECDTLSRWGGEEFLFLLPDTKLDQANEVAERIRQNIEELKIVCSDELTLNITSTFGVAEYQENETFDETLARADQALYKGKDKGRNIVVFE